MNYFINRENQIGLLEKRFSDELDFFPDYLRDELTSLLAFAINEVNNSNCIRCFSNAISHITQQKGFMSYSSLTEDERLCVDIFAQQEIPKQEHIVFSSKNILDTLRIYDAPANSIETISSPLVVKAIDGLFIGFNSMAKYLKQKAVRVVSMKTGGRHDK
ncbi:hypothetical protein [Paraglaciecola arctica]|uniref:hypothetical protein n=1 Tax=Paraglaciecola arctica TaxID=1128911 RepID=UPI001C07CE6F|nr:hypothetical protein [Paraglaciecola arctica]MBU3004283.1 hypothetical protein [Paraglaciecola arctica]